MIDGNRFFVPLANYLQPPQVEQAKAWSQELSPGFSHGRLGQALEPLSCLPGSLVGGGGAELRRGSPVWDTVVSRDILRTLPSALLVTEIVCYQIYMYTGDRMIVDSLLCFKVCSSVFYFKA